MSRTGSAAPEDHARSVNQALFETGRATVASARVPPASRGIVATTAPFETISSRSTGTIERRLTFAASGRPASASAISSPTSRPSSVNESSGPFVAKLRPALSAASQAPVVELAARAHEDAIHPDRAAQRREVRHGVGSRARRQAEAAVEQAIPDLRGRAVIAEPDDLDVVGLAERDVHRERVGDRVRAGRVGRRRIERVDVSR